VPDLSRNTVVGHLCIREISADTTLAGMETTRVASVTIVDSDDIHHIDEYGSVPGKSFFTRPCPIAPNNSGILLIILSHDGHAYPVLHTFSIL
jgi:hypothetical protein